MKRQYYLAIFIIGLLVRISVAWLQNSPGFMDAEYYFVGGKQLAQGDGFSENILWHYLDDPAGIPHPSHGYWMPLTSMLAAVGMAVTGSQSFKAAQIIFILIGSLLPPLTAYLCFQLTKTRGAAILAGSLAILPAFYLPYMTTSDTFGIYAALGAVFFILLSESFASKRFLTPYLLGIIAGLMHLSRADGLLWLGFAIISVIFYIAPKNQQDRSIVWLIFEGSFLVIGGYLTIMGPWFFRNIQIFEFPLSPGGSRSLWIIEYNELFIYPGSQLTLERWWAAGLEKILDARLWAMKINLQRSIGEQGMIFLTPLILLGLWQFRRDFRIKIGFFIWVITFVVMTFVFPYQGARGGYFHSSAALLPILWSAAAIGFFAALEWAERVRNWNAKEAGIIFSIAIIFFAGLLSTFVIYTNFLSGDSDQPKWEENKITYQNLEESILELGIHPEDIVMTINPPGYYAHSSRAAIAIPDGNLQILLTVAQKYNGKILILEKDHPDGLEDLYTDPEVYSDRLKYLMSVDGTHIFLIE